MARKSRPVGITSLSQNRRVAVVGSGVTSFVVGIATGMQIVGLVDGEVLAAPNDAWFGWEGGRGANPDYWSRHPEFLEEDRLRFSVGAFLVRGGPLGERVVRPVQLVDSEWAVLGDVDPALAARTREALVREIAGDGGSSSTLVAGLHFPGLALGRLVGTKVPRHWTV